MPYPQGVITDRSGTITLGGTAQTICAANTGRRYFLFENVSDIDMWLNFGTTAVAASPSIKILAGGSFVMESEFCATQLVSLIGATTGRAFMAKEGQ